MSNSSQQPGHGMLLNEPVDLTPFNTLALPCQARQMVVVSAPEQLVALGPALAQCDRLLVLGGGSNLVLPRQLSALVLKVALKGIVVVQDTPDHVVVEVQAGESWHDWVLEATARGWWGLENLALIPGTVGAAPVQNIGAYGVELHERIDSVTAWHVATQAFVTLSRAECEFDYRDSLFKRAPQGTWVIVSVRFVLSKNWQPVLTYPALRQHPLLTETARRPFTAQQVLEAVCAIRQAKLPDPAWLANAGSFFKNPIVSATQYQALRARYAELVAYPQADGTVKLAAGWLIEHCGLKGLRQGAVGVHAQQALVLVNYGGAQASELLVLASRVIQTIQDTFGVTLEIEPVVV